ncbi:MAG: hypothetical protein HKP25_15775 [Marinicaulis sp.]|nr:hypothetical protein [Marinicaulis sp.]
MKVTLTLIGLLFLLATPARADFGDCTSPEYMSGFDDGSEGVDPSAPHLDITCVIEFEFEYPTPSGPRRIRGIRDINADWAFREGALAQVEAGARAAVAAMRQIGPYEVDDITLLILDDTYGRLDDAEDNRTGALTVSRSHNECLVDVYMLSTSGAPEFVPFVIGHEIFHCIQHASLTRAQMRTSTEEGVWWTEGSADYFGALTDPDSPLTLDRTRRFERRVEEGVPIYDMDYDAAIFFYWFHRARGSSQLMPFLQQMASMNSDSAQRAAMRSALSDEEWLSFVEAYADRKITTTAGASLGFAEEGDAIDFNNTRTERIPLEPFVITRGWLKYDCGEWENELRPDPVNLEARRESESDWGGLPDTIDTEEADSVRYRYAAINTRDSRQRVELEVERIRSCEPCGGSEEIDICLLGEWEMTGGGPIEWMRAQGVPITRADPGQRIVGFDERGIYYSKAFSTGMTIDLDEEQAEAEGAALPAVGRWSVSRPAKNLTICQDSGGMSGTVTTPNVSFPVAQAGGGQIVMDYACSRTTLNTSQDLGSGPRMETTYTRLTPPPEEMD